ncbi:RNA methyltransferase [Patescibacteria group bacterium]
MKDEKKELCFILHNIRSAYNVGSIFRTADSVGVSRMYLSGYTPTPFVYKNKALHQTKAEKMLAKTALGAQAYLEWEKSEDIFELIDSLKNDGYKVIALEQDEVSVSYDELESGGKMALILGNEPSGVDQEVLDVCDSIIEIPMRGRKKSLNVSVAAGVASYELMK